MTTRAPSESRVAYDPFTPSKPTAYIVGFAPSWDQTPWSDPTGEFWGMNALHKLAPDRPWTHWFQLHDIDKHHKEDKGEHLSWLVSSGLLVFMWDEHIVRYPLPNAVPYPREEVIAAFGRYFTNTVSWMIALAVLRNHQKIGVYGVDMAQDSEYGSQRPSCEWMLGIAAGRGIEIDIPTTSDLLKSPYLYGFEDGDAFRTKMEFRLKELTGRQTHLQQQQAALNQELLQVMGAAENMRYILRSWTQPTLDGKASS